MVRISSHDGELMLFDGRLVRQNGWYVVRSILPTGRTGKVLTWTVEPHAIDNWVREPNSGLSQVGYVPEQPKISVIELDRNDVPLQTASIHRGNEDGSTTEAITGNVEPWGDHVKYHYVRLDFTSVNTPGIEYIKNADNQPNTTMINNEL